MALQIVGCHRTLLDIIRIGLELLIAFANLENLNLTLVEQYLEVARGRFESRWSLG